MIDDSLIEILGDRDSRMMWLLGFALVVGLFERATWFLAGRRDRYLQRRSQVRREAEAWAALEPEADSPEFHHHAVKYAAVVDPHRQSPEMNRVRDIAEGIQAAQVAFESEGLDWYLAHADRSQFEDMAQVAEDIGAPALSGPIHEAAKWLGWSDRPEVQATGYDGDTTHPAFQAYEEQLDLIAARFDALGGIDLFRQQGLSAIRDNLKAYRASR